MTAVTEEMLEAGARAIGQALHASGVFKRDFDDPWTAGPCLLAAPAAYTAMRSLDPEWIAMREALETAQRALKPISDRVFNDNGDHTLSTAPFDDGVYSDCYFAERKINAALQPRQSK